MKEFYKKKLKSTISILKEKAEIAIAITKDKSESLINLVAEIKGEINTGKDEKFINKKKDLYLNQETYLDDYWAEEDKIKPVSNMTKKDESSKISHKTIVMKKHREFKEKYEK